MVPLLKLLYGLTQVVPAVAGVLGGAGAEEKAEHVAGLVRAVTGQEDVAAGVEQIKADPQAALAFQAALMQHERDSYVAETARLVAVNETMRAEAASGDPYQRRWRPTFGYIAAVTWAIQGLVVFGVVGYVAVTHPENVQTTVGAVTGLLSALADHWLYALSVLGVAVWQRSADKKVAAGAPTGLSALVAMVKGKG